MLLSNWTAGWAWQHTCHTYVAGCSPGGGRRGAAARRQSVTRSEQMNAIWIKSSVSFSNGNCVEVASLPGGAIGVRNSRDPEGPVLKFTPGVWMPSWAARGSGTSTGSAGLRAHQRRAGAAQPSGTQRPVRSGMTPGPVDFPRAGGAVRHRAPPQGRTRRHHVGSPPAAARQPPGHRLRRRLAPLGPFIRSLPAEAVELPVPHAAEKSMPLIRRELQDRPSGISAVANADLAPGQARHLDAVAVGVTQGALDPVRT